MLGYSYINLKLTSQAIETIEAGQLLDSTLSRSSEELPDLLQGSLEVRAII